MNDHWEKVYQTKDTKLVSWYQPHTTISIDWIKRINLPADAHIIDVGGGASILVDELLDLGYRNITVLDISKSALEVSRQRLGEKSIKVQWLDGDITRTHLPIHSFYLWHDRAVFHFLTEARDQKKYLSQLDKSVKVGGHIIMAAFALDGPDKCSGLPVMRYSPESLHEKLGSHFRLFAHRKESHITPSGSTQNFIYCHFIKMH